MHHPSTAGTLTTLPADHIDLILTAAIEFGTIAAPTGTPRPVALVTAMAQRIGTHLFLRNDIRDNTGYRFRPVEGPLDLRDVLKACHAAQFAYHSTRLWAGSTEKEVVDAVAKAASMRTPGYDLAPWIWRRPTQEVLAIAAPGTWHPDIDNVAWISDAETISSQWNGARIVLLTRSGLAGLPSVPPRPRVFLIVEAPNVGQGIHDGERAAAVENVLVWPDAAAWLKEQTLL